MTLLTAWGRSGLAKENTLVMPVILERLKKYKLENLKLDREMKNGMCSKSQTPTPSLFVFQDLLHL